MRKAAIALLASLLMASLAFASPSYRYERLPDEAFTPVVPPGAVLDGTARDGGDGVAYAPPPPVPIHDTLVLPPMSPPRVDATQPRPEPVAEPIDQGVAGGTGTGSGVARLTGKASWYCKAGRSVCHHAYPDRPGCDHATGARCDYYAAACGKLRAAMGSKWRNDRVTITRGGRSLVVKLVDWCGSKDKTIDLYWDAMDYFGGTGVIKVTVGW